VKWWSAYGKDAAAQEVAQDEANLVFTGNYTPGDKPLTVVLLPALFVGDWMWEGIYQRVSEAGWPVDLPGGPPHRALDQPRRGPAPGGLPAAHERPAGRLR
jgi:hypothetical protein